MSRHRRSLIVALTLAVLGGTAERADAEIILMLTTRQVLALDLADTTVVSHFGLPASVGTSVKGIAAGASPVLLTDTAGRRVWSVDDAFTNPVEMFALPLVNAEGLVRLTPPVPGVSGGPAGNLVVNGQAPMVPPDTLFVLNDATGAVIERFPMPAAVTALKDLAFDGEDLWGVDASGGGRLWRIDPTTGAFEESFTLPASPILACAWNPVTSELWLFQSAQGTEIVAYTVDRTTGMGTEVLRVDEGAVTFVLAAAFTDAVTAVDITSWGAVKARFAR